MIKVEILQEHLITKILVVDDRNENLFAMEKILKTLACEVYKAHSGNEALSLTLRHDFALMLLDVNMPEMDGFELAELLRENDKTKWIPIIFVTAINKEDNSVFKGYETGAVDYLFKPINTDILLSKVKVFLELDLQKKELEAIRKELERSNESLMEFAQIVSHDLKNPLNVVTGLSEIVLSKYGSLLPDKGIECMKHISNAAERMTQLVTNLLAYAQVDAQSVSLTSVDLNEVIADVIADLNARIEQSNAQVEIINLLPTLETDRTHMYQVFQNLIGNAIKYHPKERNPIITIASAASDEPGFCLISMEDNGIGMEQEEMAQIFMPFKRLNNSKEFEGSGLGLATVKKIVEQHQGSIEVTSQLGLGSTFRVFLRVNT